MNKEARYVLFASMAVLVLIVSQVVFAQAPIRLQFNLKTGDVCSYALTNIGSSTVVIEGDTEAKKEAEMNMDLLFRWKVVKENADGTLDVSITMLEGGGLVNDEPEEMGNIGKTVIMKLARSGKIVDLGPEQMTADITKFQLEFPDKPLAIGDSWTVSAPLSKSYPVPLVGTFTFTGFERIDGYDCAVIEKKIKCRRLEQLDDMIMEVDLQGKTYFAYREGKMIRSELTSSMLLVMPVDADLFSQESVGSDKKYESASKVTPDGAVSGKSEEPLKITGSAAKMQMKLQLTTTLKLVKEDTKKD